MIFNLWSPTRIDAYEVRFDVTQANMPRVGTGDEKWVNACLKALGITAPARSWSIRAARCHFYSDYPDEPEWLDRWPDTWIVRVELAGTAPDDFGAPDPLPVQIDEYDRSWEYGETDPGHDHLALLQLLWHGDAAEAASLADPPIEWLRSEIGDVSVVHERPGGEWSRLRVVAVGNLFPERLDALEDFVRRCREQGLIANRHEMA